MYCNSTTPAVLQLFQFKKNLTSPNQNSGTGTKCVCKAGLEQTLKQQKPKEP